MKTTINNTINRELELTKPINQGIKHRTKMTDASLPTHLPWLLIQRDNLTLMKIAYDQQQPESSRISALEALGRRGDGGMESKLALLSKKDNNMAIKQAAYRALSRSQYTRSKQGLRVTQLLEGIR